MQCGQREINGWLGDEEVTKRERVSLGKKAFFPIFLFPPETV